MYFLHKLDYAEIQRKLINCNLTTLLCGMSHFQEYCKNLRWYATAQCEDIFILIKYYAECGTSDLS